MSQKQRSNSYHYKITLEGHLDDRWHEWFDGLAINYEGRHNNNTILTGLVADQAALRGLLNQIWDFNLALVAVERWPHDAPPNSEVSHES